MKVRDVMTRDVIGSSGKSDCPRGSSHAQKKINGLSSVDASGLSAKSIFSPRPVNDYLWDELKPSLEHHIKQQGKFSKLGDLVKWCQKTVKAEG